MRNYSTKMIVFLLVLFVLMLLFSGCPTDTLPLESAIFSEVEKIKISTTANPMEPNGEFIYELPKEVKYAIVELFPPGTNFDDSEKKVPVEVLIAGNRTGLDGFTRDSVYANKLFPVNADNTDFDFSGANYIGPGPTDYIWIVLGYDENMILTHASPAGEVTINWP